MLMSTYNPDSTAGCPECGTVKCLLTGGITFGCRPFLQFLHKECGTEWKYYIHEGISEVLSEEAQRPNVLVS